MRIRSKLLVNTGLSAALVVLIGIVLLITTRYVGEISDRGRTANNIVKGVFELTIITDEYLLNRQPRAIQQWNLKYDSLAKIFGTLRYDNPEAQAILTRISQEHKGLKNTFDSLTQNHANIDNLTKRHALLISIKPVTRKSTKNKALVKQINQINKELFIYKKLDERVISQLLSKTQAMVSGGLQLSTSSKAEVKETETVAALTIMGIVLSLGLINIIASLLINRSVVNPIKHVTNATRIISEGNLQHRIGHHRDDEIGELSKTFDDMMNNLSTTTASRDELNDMNEKLKDSTSQLIQSEKMASIGQMVAGVAHEINTPLAYVRSSVELVKEELPEITQLIEAYDKLRALLVGSGSEEEISAQFNVITGLAGAFQENQSLEEANTLLTRGLHGLDQISELVMNMKNFSRMDREKVTEYNLNEGVDSVLLLATPVLKRHVTVEKSYGNIPPVTCSPSQVNQVLMNVITNAAQAMDGKPGTIWITTASDGEQAQIKIKDTGIGIAKDKIEHIFDPFFTTKLVGEGTGLGLSIAHKIMEEHGGSIIMDSEIGKGSVATISLPVKGVVEQRKRA